MMQGNPAPLDPHVPQKAGFHSRLLLSNLINYIKYRERDDICQVMFAHVASIVSKYGGVVHGISG